MRAARGEQGRNLRRTARPFTPDRTARMEAASGRRVRRGRRLSGDGNEPLLIAVDARDAAQQSDRVGMAGPFEEIGDRRGFHDAAAVHHGHPVSHAGDHAEIMGDQHDRGAGLGLAFGEQRQHLCLHRDVERGRRLVGDDQRGVARHRHRDHRALAHAARELVRVLMHAPGGIGDIDLAQQFDCPLARHALRDLAVRDLALRHLATDGQDRVQGRRRVLEDHADVPAPHSPQHLPPCRGHLDRAEAHRAANPRGLRQQAGDRERGHALAGARFADDAEHLVRIDIEIDAPHRRHLPAGAGERHREPADGEDRIRHQATRSPRHPRFRQLVNPTVRATSMLSISRVRPPTFFAATIRPMSYVLVAMPKADCTSTWFRLA